MTTVRSGAQRFRTSAMVVVALFLGAFMLPVWSDSRAQAAVPSVTVSFGGWEVGGFLSSTGYFVYCIEPGSVEPSGDQQQPYAAETIRGYTASSFDPTGWNGPVTSGPASGEVLRQMNWLLANHGQTTDPDTAAAVQLALWILRNDPGASGWLTHHLNWVASHGGASHVDRAHQMAAESRQRAVPPVRPTPAAPLEISLAAAHGEGSVTFPAGTTKLRITGGYFEGGRTEIELGGDAGSASWRIVPHEHGWERSQTVTVSGEWKADTVEWPAALMMHSAVISQQQGLGSVVGPVHGTVAESLDEVSVEIDHQFSPRLTTQVEEQFVPRAAGRFADQVTFTVDEGSAPWAARDSESGTVYAPVTAEGVLYGPYAQPQEIRSEPPRGAPVAARASIRADRGPGDYRVTADAIPKESGYYTWVWRIEEETQDAEVRAAQLLPQGYRFSDRFGLAEEGHVVPTSLRWRTELEERVLRLDRLRLQDRLDVRLRDGAWLQNAEGSRIPAKLRLAVYRTDAEPVRQSSAPDTAEEIAHGFLTVSETGRGIAAPTIDVPFETRGWVTVQTCLYAEDQDEAARGHVEEWCDDFGMPAETARIDVPTVRTEAQARVSVGESFRDTAVVDGLVPEGAELGFTYYLEPAPGEPKYDEQWEPVIDERGEPVLWTVDELESLHGELRCLAQPVATTERIAVVGAGRLESPEVTARTVGTGYWVEDLSMPHPDTGEPVELHRGACGLENERTVIEDIPEPEPSESPEPQSTQPPELPVTGGGPLARAAVLGAVPMVGLGVGLLAYGSVRRRREESEL
ncbi:MAG: hypothetical protein WDA07_12475 [Leucobacter sp.]